MPAPRLNEAVANRPRDTSIAARTIGLNPAVVHSDRAAARRDQPSVGSAKSTARAGHQNDLTVEIDHPTRLPRHPRPSRKAIRLGHARAGLHRIRPT
jgi:hypothetical protein